MKSISDRFIQALQAAESNHDPEELISLFAQNCHLDDLVHHEPCRGVEGARQFWVDYLSSFDDIHSDIQKVIEKDDTVVLEWTSSGSLKTGIPIEYQGVSILESDGERITHFRSYYDSAAFSHPKIGLDASHPNDHVERNPAEQISS